MDPVREIAVVRFTRFLTEDPNQTLWLLRPLLEELEAPLSLAGQDLLDLSSRITEDQREITKHTAVLQRMTSSMLFTRRRFARIAGLLKTAIRVRLLALDHDLLLMGQLSQHSASEARSNLTEMGEVLTALESAASEAPAGRDELTRKALRDVRRALGEARERESAMKQVSLLQRERAGSASEALEKERGDLLDQLQLLDEIDIILGAKDSISEIEKNMPLKDHLRYMMKKFDSRIPATKETS